MKASFTYPYHQKAWGLWLLAALTPAILTQNPFYLLIIILAAGINYYSLGRKSPAAQGWTAFLYLGLILIGFTIIFNLLFVRAGATHLFTLPKLRWETSNELGQMTVLQIGGRVSLESVVYGLTTGLSLMAILLTLTTFNTLANHYQLMRSAPPFLYQSAIVMSIAVTFIPHMFIAQREIREAQALRGHRFRHIRDLLPLFVTLLAEGLERSITLAESMEARGFSRQAEGSTTQPGLLQLGLLKPGLLQPGLLIKSLIALALLVLVGGVFGWSYFSNKLIGGLVMLGGGAMLAGALWLVGHKVQRSRYRRDIWRRRDTLVAVTSIIVILSILALWLSWRSAFTFYPYPRLYWPPFNPFIGLALLLIAAPALAGRLAGEVAYD